jgi:hypothetical protein
MSRRFSDEPINLIDRIPSREQISAARPSKRSWGRAVLESGAACVRGLAEGVAQLRRFGRMVCMVSSDGVVSGQAFLARAKAFLVHAKPFLVHTKERATAVTRTAAVRFSHSYDRLAEWIANLDVAVPPVPPTRYPQAAVPSETVPPVPPGTAVSAQLQELAELRASIVSQQQEIAHVSVQLQELKALVVSQQQVLVFLGKELEATQPPSVATVTSAPAKRARVIRTKPGAKEKKLPSKGAQKPSLNL